MAKTQFRLPRRILSILILVLCLSLLGSPFPVSSMTQAASSSAPLPFGKASPTDAASGLATSLTLDWADSVGSLSYEYCSDFMINGHCDSRWVATGSASQASVSGLLGGTTYEWQARAVNWEGTTPADDGTWWSFSTLASVGDAYEEDDVSLDARTISDPGIQDHRIAPIGDQDWIRFTLSASSSILLNTSGPGYGDTVLDLYQANGTDLIETDDDSGVGSYASIDRVCGLDPLPAGSYVARVREQGDDYSVSGYMLSFTSAPCFVPVYSIRVPFVKNHSRPDAFGKLGPAYDQTGVLSYTSLDWEDALSASGYEYCIDTASTGPCAGAWISSGAASEAYLATPLEHATAYRWQVRANNPAGTTYADDGTWWRFTTAPATADWLILTAEDFEGTFPKPGWSTYDWGLTGGEYLPGKRDCNVHSGSYSGWMIGGGQDGSNLACGAAYQPYHDTWLIYGPFSTKGATGGYLNYNLYMNNNDDIWDYLWVLASDNYDSNEWWGNYYHDNFPWWEDSIRLSNHLCNNGTESCLGRDEVYIAFDFLTDGDPDSVAGTGALLDNIVLTLCMAESCTNAPPAIRYALPANPLMDFTALWNNLHFARGVRSDFHP